VAILNNSLINVAIPKLTNVFGSTTDRIQWVLTGYMLASGVIIPISGYMGDRIGYKKFFIISLGVFTAGTL
ncbi:MFS transporter, partial [Cohnella sp. REN36]